jgi:ribosome-associated protein
MRASLTRLAYIREDLSQEVNITSDTIRLGQLLKLAGVVGSGSEVKDLLASEPVLVNGEPEDRRGRQLSPGDVVRVGDEELRVAHGGG